MLEVFLGVWETEELLTAACRESSQLPVQPLSSAAFPFPSAGITAGGHHGAGLAEVESGLQPGCRLFGGLQALPRVHLEGLPRVAWRTVRFNAWVIMGGNFERQSSHLLHSGRTGTGKLFHLCVL